MAEVKEHIAEMLDIEMDRIDFLQYSGKVFLAAFGVAGLISTLIDTQKRKKNTGTTMKGYGSSRFGKS